MELTVDHLFDLIGKLGTGFQFSPVSDKDTVLTLEKIDPEAKSVTINGRGFGEAYFARIAEKVKEKVPITANEVNQEGGSNRAYLLNLLSYTKEFYCFKDGKTFFVWIPDATHPAKKQGIIDKDKAYKMCDESDIVLENIILYGPPGTGKTFSTKERAVKIIEGHYDPVAGPFKFQEYLTQERIVFVTFHQSYAYEDFVEGVQVDMTSSSSCYEPKPGVFQKLCTAALKAYKENPDNPDKYVLIIDEINRGNISKVFGELITLIEPSKRIGGVDELTVTLPYSQKSFGVPKNLFIIGTMNSADKSISVIDSALRRRFRFINYEPDVTKLKAIGTGPSKVDIVKMLDMINRRITALLDKDHTIGHTYFKGVSSLPELALVFRDIIIPLLQETFFNNMQEVSLVLNGGDDFTKNPANRFLVEDPKYKHKELFGKPLEEHDQKAVLVLNPLLRDDKLKKIKPGFFRAIYEKSK